MRTVKCDVVGWSRHPSVYLRSCVRVYLSKCRPVWCAQVVPLWLYNCCMHDTAGGRGVKKKIKRKLRLVLSLPESIVIQPEPEGRELIIPRFAGIIEQMCFEIGHRTIEVPVVIFSQTCMVCNAETQEGWGGSGEHRRQKCRAWAARKHNTVAEHNSSTPGDGWKGN